MPSDMILLFGGSCSERRVSVASAQYLATCAPGAACWFWAPDGAVFEVPGSLLLAHQQPFEQDFHPPGKPAYRALEQALDHASSASTFFLALHGGAGEDGTVQAMLEQRGLCFTGSDAAACRRAFNKVVAKECVRRAGGQVARSVLLECGEQASAAQEEAAHQLLHACGRLVLKPVADGSSCGLMFVSTDAEWQDACAQIAKGEYGAYLAEEFIPGRELTVGVVETAGTTRALPCSEVRVERGRAFDFAGKYLGQGAREITPAQVPASVHEAAGRAAMLAHQAAGCRGYSRTDLILSGDSLVFLEINSLPGLTRVSFIPQQLAAAGISMEGFLAEQIALARTRVPCCKAATDTFVPASPQAAASASRL